MGKPGTAPCLTERGIEVIGTDVCSLDRNFDATRREFPETGDRELLWEAHFAGIGREYCQIENLANLDRTSPVRVQGLVPAYKDRA
jgi:cyclase